MSEFRFRDWTYCTINRQSETFKDNTSLTKLWDAFKHEIRLLVDLQQHQSISGYSRVTKGNQNPLNRHLLISITSNKIENQWFVFKTKHHAGTHCYFLRNEISLSWSRMIAIISWAATVFSIGSWWHFGGTVKRERTVRLVNSRCMLYITSHRWVLFDKKHFFSFFENERTILNMPPEKLERFNRRALVMSTEKHQT